MTVTRLVWAVKLALAEIDGSPLEVRFTGPHIHTRRHPAQWGRVLTVPIRTAGTYQWTEMFEVNGPLIDRVLLMTAYPDGLWCKPGDTVTVTPDFHIVMPQLRMSDRAMAQYLTRPPKELH